MDYKKYDNLKIKPGFLEKVINSDSQNDIIQNEELFVDVCEAKYMRIDSKVFSEVLIILEEAFKGFFVMNNQSFIKKNDFGKAICNEKISIKKVVNNYVFDSEGMECKNKYLIKKGILENCLNNIYTASVLKLEPGDSVYNYELGNHVIGAKKLIMEYDKCSEIVPEADIYIVQIKKDTISFDFDSGYFQAVFIGKEKNKKIRYMMRCNIIDLLNSIVAVIDNNYDTDSYEKDVILDLGKLK